MVLPTQSNIELPLLKAIADNGGQLPLSEAIEKVTSYFSEITKEDLAQRNESGANKWINAVQWVRQKLITKGELDGSTRGIWKITSKGLTRLEKERPSTIVPSMQKQKVSQEKTQSDINPEEKIELARSEIITGISKEILSILLKMDPGLFEGLIGELLKKRGYGSIKITGRSGDGGIDGECSIDELGLYKLHFQAKRWQNQVSPKEVRDLIGAIQTRRGDYGIFVTTSTFSRDALETAKLSGKIKTIDGQELSKLMIKYGLGVKKILLDFPKIDYGFFDGTY